jgi:hypothetical protein
MIELKAGMRFGRLVTYTKSVKSFWICYCDCGSLKEVTASALMNGQSSCGCIRKLSSAANIGAYRGNIDNFMAKEIRRSSDSLIEE